MNPKRDINLPVRTDADLLEHVETIVGRALRRQAWLLFLDGDDDPVPLAVPFEDYPPRPERDLVSALAGIVETVVGDVPGARVVVVWERPGARTATPGDLAWSRAFAAACAERGLPVRGQFVSHPAGILEVRDDELADAA